MAERIDVMISSTARDLPAYRQEALDACVRQGMFPIMMEHLPAMDEDAISASLAMVDEAEIYLGLFARRYGYIPQGYDISITEIEYNRACERGIPRLIFIMQPEEAAHLADDGDPHKIERLKRFRARLETDQVVNYFSSPADLRAQIINSLAQYYKRQTSPLHRPHFIIPTAPDPYIAHPYTLLESGGLYGRQAELAALNDWVASPTNAQYPNPVLNIVALGGMGKSSLAWAWFNQHATELRLWSGRLWWSFYESNAHYENFVTRALAYTSHQPEDIIRRMSLPARELELINTLDQQPFLLVLDGLERILIAYNRADNLREQDEPSAPTPPKSGMGFAKMLGFAGNVKQEILTQHRLRKTSDPRAGAFLRKLTSLHASRVLISTRLYPADLASPTKGRLPGSGELSLSGLSAADALALWRAFGVSGSEAALNELFQAFDYYPLLIRALAAEVANYRRAPGDFDRWRSANPNFNPFTLPIAQSQSHVLHFALSGLEPSAFEVLRTVAAFTSPATYDMLADLLIESVPPASFILPEDNLPEDNLPKGNLPEGNEAPATLPESHEPAAPVPATSPEMSNPPRPFKNETDLDRALTELEDRGLLGWDRGANRYDLHPVVRGIIWNNLDLQDQHALYERLHAYFAALPAIENWRDVSQPEDLTASIELYHTLIGLGRYDAAHDILSNRLYRPLRYRLSDGQTLAGLIEMLFPDGANLPKLRETSDQAWTLNALAQAYQMIGQPGRAVPLFEQSNQLKEAAHYTVDLSSGLRDLAYAQRLIGGLRYSEVAARRALSIDRGEQNRLLEAISLQVLGLALAARGAFDESAKALDRSLDLADRTNANRAYNHQAMRALWMGDYGAALEWAEKAIIYCTNRGLEAGLILAHRLYGEAALGLEELTRADEHLTMAITQARAVNFMEEEIAALIALARLNTDAGNLKRARDLLEDVWQPLEHGTYRLFYADACNAMAALEIAQDAPQTAIEAATYAYQAAWCDGPPYAYQRALQIAEGHLRLLNVPPPKLPPFDVDATMPMIYIEIDPPEA